jgi:NAD(P)-dependent dehydrogenase (short-subunit alcohol dehydrogenase family)
MNQVAGRRILVVGASRGLGRGIACAFAESGAEVIAVGRSAPALTELAASHPTVRVEVADATDSASAWNLIDQHDPDVLVLVAGGNPVMRELRHHTWETFSINWHSDVRIAFTWLREALLKPLRPGSHIVVVSSGAALNGSPLSGGYAGAKATQRFLAQYAQGESERAALGITVTTVMPRMTPHGDIGRRGIRAYAALSGESEATFIEKLGTPTTPDIAGAAIVELVRQDAPPSVPGYLLTGAGLQPLT